MHETLQELGEEVADLSPHHPNGLYRRLTFFGAPHVVRLSRTSEGSDKVKIELWLGRDLDNAVRIGSRTRGPNDSPRNIRNSGTQAQKYGVSIVFGLFQIVWNRGMEEYSSVLLENYQLTEHDQTTT